MRVLGIEAEQVSLEESPIDGVECGKGVNHGFDSQSCNAAPIPQSKREVWIKRERP
jgi:hypothetical protein